MRCSQTARLRSIVLKSRSGGRSTATTSWPERGVQTALCRHERREAPAPHPGDDGRRRGPDPRLRAGRVTEFGVSFTADRRPHGRLRSQPRSQRLGGASRSWLSADRRARGAKMRNLVGIEHVRATASSRRSASQLCDARFSHGIRVLRDPAQPQSQESARRELQVEPRRSSEGSHSRRRELPSSMYLPLAMPVHGTGGDPRRVLWRALTDLVDRAVVR